MSFIPTNLAKGTCLTECPTAFMHDRLNDLCNSIMRMRMPSQAIQSCRPAFPSNWDAAADFQLQEMSSCCANEKVARTYTVFPSLFIEYTTPASGSYIAWRVWTLISVPNTQLVCPMSAA
jgi:hypothetical protein